MSDDVLATTEDGRFRVRLVHDDHAKNPRNDRDTLVHVITIDTHHGKYHPIDQDGGPLAAAWDFYGWNRWGGIDNFIRYAAIYHDAIVLESNPHDGPRSLWYMTGEEAIALDCGLLTEGYIEAEMEEYEAWASGDVWSFVIEQRVGWTRDDDPDESLETWEHVDSCSGFYGGTYAREQAREALAFYAARSTNAVSA
ncbi:hypothetical protein ACTVZO_16185 [Streptomyces sp. IBSNAI002]|uniref:hypothetical protein n=1 Tax=Streptomyces sp. IBSNAI002 TaxID=3457500 RepID=UPI003FCF5EC6